MEKLACRMTAAQGPGHRGRGVGEALGSVNVEFESAKELHRAGGVFGCGTAIGDGGVAGADGLSGGEGGKEYEKRGERDGEFRELGGIVASWCGANSCRIGMVCAAKSRSGRGV